MLDKTKKQRLKKFIPLIALLVIFFVMAFFVYLHYHTNPKPVTASGYTKGEPSQRTNDSSSQQSGTTPSSNKNLPPGTSAPTYTALIAPFGDFVSDHNPNLSGYPAPSTETSVCTTTPGAKCVITFTKNEATKSLTAEITDAGGSAYWNWSLQDLGITQGVWTIQATVYWAGQTKSTQDAMKLDVQP